MQDNKYGTWSAYQNQYWPAEYLIDAKGQVRHTQFGEGDYKQDEAAVRAAAARGGRAPPAAADDRARDHALASSSRTPETYLDDQRSQGFAQPLKSGVRPYPAAPDNLQLNEFALKGIWWVTDQSATPVGKPATVSGSVQAAHVYLVMTSAGNMPRTGRVLLDGHPISSQQAGADVHDGEVTVRGQRLYSLVSLPQARSST